MVARLKGTLKGDLEALQAGQPIAAAADGDGAEGKKTPKKPRTPKRKNKADGEDEQDATPKKRGRKKVDAEPTVQEEGGGDGDLDGDWDIVEI